MRSGGSGRSGDDRLFYHPAVWWVSSEVRAEREHCCDDLAVDVCGDRLVYVSALAELTSMERRAFALAATDGSLVARVRRILGRPAADARREMPPSWAVLVLLVLVGGGAGTYEMSADAEAVSHIAQAAAAPAHTWPDSSYVKGVYYSALLKQADLPSAQWTRMIDRAASELTSDHEKGTLLRQILEARAISADQRALAARVAARINSDHEQRQVYLMCRRPALRWWLRWPLRS